MIRALALGLAVVATHTFVGPSNRVSAGSLGERAGPTCVRPYSPRSPWNRPIGPKPVYDPRSNFHLTALRGELLSDPRSYAFPVYRVSSDAPLQTVTISGWYSRVYASGTRLRTQERGTLRLPLPASARPAAGDDAQIVLVNPLTGDEWGLWRLERDPAGAGWKATNAYRYNTRWNAVPPQDRGGGPFVARGAGIPYLAGLVRRCEITRRRIEHALAFAYDYPTQRYVYPATKSDGIGTDPADLPEGARLQLDPRLSAAEIRAWGCRGACFTIARALQVYGMYVVDNSARMKLMVEDEQTAHWRGALTSKTVRPIRISAFKVLRLGRQR